MDDVAMRVEILAPACPPPRSAQPDEISASLHAVGVGLLHLGGSRVLANAFSVLSGVVSSWPSTLRPNEKDIAKLAGWVVRQDSRSRERPDADPLAVRIEAAIAGKLVAIPWPWPSVGRLTQALMPGSVTLLVGSPGASKSFAILQATLWWLSQGVKVALYALEEDAGFWLNRALAVVSKCGSTTDPAWVAENPAATREIAATYRAELDDVACALTTAPAVGVSLAGLGEWVEKQAKNGARIIACDPVTAAVEGDTKAWVAAQAFMLRAKRACAEHGASLILTSHGRKQSGMAKGPPDLDDLAGGAAYARFASCVLWLDAMAESEEVAVVRDGVEQIGVVNRRLRILKAREGRGTGMAIGMRFNGPSLNMSEEGVILCAARQAQAAKRIAKPGRISSRPTADEDMFTEAGKAG